MTGWKMDQFIDQAYLDLEILTIFDLALSFELLAVSNSVS